MTVAYRYVAKTMFKNKVLQYVGQQYEDFFVSIMKCHNHNFQPVKAHGNIGDRKNDGFDKDTGTYYQVFAPEDVTKKSTIDDTVDKLEKDFKGLYAYWNSICPIEHYNFVLNDKYKGLAAPMIEKIISLGKEEEYKNVKLSFFTAKDLENVFDKLTEIEMQDIIGFIPDVDLPLLEYEALAETVLYLMNIEIDFPTIESLIAPDFDEKIVFNHLSAVVSNLLTNGSYQNGVLLDYFNNSRGIKEILQGKFQALYEESKILISESTTNSSDQRFFYILDKSCVKKTQAIRTSVLVLMSYYFSACDIFEEPK